jgi:hypothetical protein
MNGVVFHTSTTITLAIDSIGSAVQASGSAIRSSIRSPWLMMPNWSLSIQPHSFADTMVGIAHGTSTAARTSARPGNRALSTSAMATPSTVSSVTETVANSSVFHTARHHCASASRPYQRPP